MHALIILNSTLPNAQTLQHEQEKAEKIFCADGGANRAHQSMIVPDYIVGDFDSLSESTRTLFAGSTFIHRPDQSQTDMEKTIEYAVECGVQSASIVGLSGGRFDHQLSNLHIMKKYAHQLELICIDDSGWGRFVHRELSLPVVPGQQISLIALQKAGGIMTSGLRFELQGESLEFGFFNGQSNEATGYEVSVTLQSGSLFVFAALPESH